MDKTIVLLVLSVFLAVVTLSTSQQNVPITVYDSAGNIVSQSNGDESISSFNPEIIPSEEAPLFFDPTGEDASLSYSPPQDEEGGIEIPQISSGEQS